MQIAHSSTDISEQRTVHEQRAAERPRQRARAAGGSRDCPALPQEAATQLRRVVPAVVS